MLVFKLTCDVLQKHSIPSSEKFNGYHRASHSNIELSNQFENLFEVNMTKLKKIAGV